MVFPIMPERHGPATPAKKNLYCIGTLDTKGPEIHFLAECLSSALARFQLDNVSDPSLPNSLSSHSLIGFPHWEAHCNFPS